jgi:hypothetical protein
MPTSFIGLAFSMRQIGGAGHDRSESSPVFLFMPVALARFCFSQFELGNRYVAMTTVPCIDFLFLFFLPRSSEQIPRHLTMDCAQFPSLCFLSSAP